MISTAAQPFSAGVEDERGLVRALALGQWLAGRAEAFAIQLDLSDLGDIELPPAAGSPADQARLHALAPLYLAAELEQALLLPAVEVLAGLYVSGGLSADIGPAGPPLLSFWQRRQQRFTVRERQALFSRLFGTPAEATLVGPGGANAGFEGAMITLTEALHNFVFDAPIGMPGGDATLRMAARQLAGNLALRAGGIATFAARDLLATIQQGVDLLKQPTLQQAFGATGFWGAVRTIARAYLDQEPVVDLHVTRGRSGMLVLTWLAQALPLLDDLAQRLTSPDHPVIPAATAWLQASLYLEEQRATSSRGA